MSETIMILPKDNLRGLLRKLGRDRRLVAPIRNDWGDTFYAEMHDLDGMEVDLAHQPQASLKEFFFPQQEVIATYELGDGYAFTPRRQVEPTVFFGVRSCDLAAVLYMDMIFAAPRRDDNYFARRQDSIIITLACNQPFERCFCNATGSGPLMEYGYDLQLTDLGGHFLVEAGRQQGETLLRAWAPFFAQATRADRELQYQLMLEAGGRFAKKVEVEHACAILARQEVAQEIWQQLSARCADCGGCAYVCPTCTCFSLRDMASSPRHGERLRAWDACTFAGFSRMAGGHNPVKPEHTLQRRFLHKLKFDVAKHGRPSCVGCGRCVDICFGHVDITTFIDAVVELDIN